MANCIKCGRELSNTRVFCGECLAEMKKHPVPPETPVYILRRPENNGKKQTQRKKPSPEELASRLRRRTAWLTGLLVALTIALGICLGLLIHQWQRLGEQPTESKGQNYSTQSSTQESTAARPG